MSRLLALAGTRAAATRRTVFLPRVPEPTPGSAEVLAHELSHVADQSAAPRFFFDDVLDAGERRARSIGSTASRRMESVGSRAFHSVTAGRAAGLMGSAGTRAAELGAPPRYAAAGGISSMGRLGEAARERAAGGLGRMTEAGGATWAQAVGETAKVHERLGSVPSAEAIAGRLIPGAASLPVAAPGLPALSAPGGLSPGFDRLTAGAAALASQGRATFGGLVGEAAAEGRSALSTAGEAAATGRSAFSAAGESAAGVAGALERDLHAVSAGASRGLEPATDRGRQALSALGSTVEGASSEVATSITGGAGETTSVLGQAGRAGAAVGSVAGQAAALDPTGLNLLLEALEERLLAELERRGGRFAGSF